MTAAHSHPTPSVDEHATLVRGLLAPLDTARGTEILPLSAALGRVTATAITSPVDLPLFRNSQMDGFAVRAADVEAAGSTSPLSLPVVGEIAARAADPAPLAPGTAVRIMTGAVVPPGADAVVPVEDTETASTAETESVLISRARAAGEFVRERGSDLAAGDELIPQGTTLAPRHLAALAASGLASVEVLAPVRVAVFTSGTELVAPGHEVEPGQVYDSNAVALAASVTACGGVVSLLAHVDDENGDFSALLHDAAKGADLILTSGGISMGDHEIVRETLAPLGAAIGHIAMQPGGPQATAVIDGVPVICFPGNPVSTQISFAVFIAPVLRELAGLPAALVDDRELAEPLRSVAGKRQFLRGSIREDGRVALVGGPSSDLVAALARADVLIDVPADATSLDAGRTVRAWHL